MSAQPLGSHKKASLPVDLSRAISISGMPVGGDRYGGKGIEDDPSVYCDADVILVAPI
jgi:hypothetical protein